MKTLFRTTILHILIFLARRRLKTTSAQVIGITGSVGKTTCKEAVVHLLQTQHTVFTSQKSYNTEFGVPLTLLEEQSGESSPLLWVPIILRSIFKAFFRPIHSEYIVLEYGVDKAGDMDLLVDICTPNIAILTKIAAVHLAADQFASTKDIFLEKVKLSNATSANKEHVVLMNQDDPEQKNWIQTYTSPATLITFSEQKMVSNLHTTKEGICCSLQLQHAQLSNIQLGIIGDWHIETLLPAILLAEHIQMPTQLIQRGLETFRLPPGRLTLIEGKNNTTLVDSSYNASPVAVKECLTVLDTIPHQRRVFVFGNMNELGTSSEALHRSLAPAIMKHTDLLITVGPGPKDTVDELKGLGFPIDAMNSFDNVFEAITWYKNNLKEHDVILVKGSQNNVRLEHFVKACMKHPELANTLLVRQSESWLQK